MKTYINLIIAVIISVSATAQINLGGIPESWKEINKIETEIPVYKTSILNMDEIKAEDEKDKQNGIPPRFGYKHEVSLSLENSGVWTELPNGGKLWQLEIYCPNAKSINFTFSEFWIPENGKLFIFGKDKKHKIGAFSELNNKGTREKLRGFATGLVYNESVILEYYQPQNQPEAVININAIVHGYRYIADYWDELKNVKKTEDFGDSGGCQVNVNCSPEGDNWQDEKTGVALILVNGNRNCTGSLINNSCNDGTLYFLTADHCIGGLDANGNTNADNCSFLWNYEAPGCSNPNSEPSLFTTNGAILKANNSLTDFALFELDESPYSLNPSQKILFNGWSRTNSPSAGGVGIHHPRGDIKKISTFTMTPISNTNCTSDPLNWWEINWVSTTNGFSAQNNGSSGSPVFTNNGHHIIGQLFGPHGCVARRCEDPGGQEVVYGRISVSWDSNSNINRQLKYWLDPCNTGVVELSGGYLDQCQNLVVVNTPINSNTAYQANNQIIASSTISSSADVEMKAGQSVTLKPGFQAQAGSDFHAHIAPCVPRVIPIAKKKEMENIEEVLETKQYNSLHLFPNPAENIVNIEFYLIEETDVQIIVTDLSGRQFAKYNQKHTGSELFETQLNVAEYAKGTFLLL